MNTRCPNCGAWGMFPRSAYIDGWRSDTITLHILQCTACGWSNVPKLRRDAQMAERLYRKLLATTKEARKE